MYNYKKVLNFTYTIREPSPRDTKTTIHKRQKTPVNKLLLPHVHNNYNGTNMKSIIQLKHNSCLSCGN